LSRSLVGASNSEIYIFSVSTHVVARLLARGVPLDPRQETPKTAIATINSLNICIASDDAAQPAVRVQAAVGLLRASEMKERIPAFAKTSEQKVAVDIRIHREELKNLDASELRKRYLDALENPED